MDYEAGDTYVNITMIYSILNKCNRNVSVVGSIHKQPKLPCFNKAKWLVPCNNTTISYLKYPPYPYGPGFIFRYSSLKCINEFLHKKKYFIGLKKLCLEIL